MVVARGRPSKLPCYRRFCLAAQSTFRTASCRLSVTVEHGFIEPWPLLLRHMQSNQKQDESIAQQNQALRSRTPILMVKMRVERGRDDVGARQRLHREEQHVGHEEQLQRSCVRYSLALDIRHRQRAWTAQQRSQAAHEPAVDRAECTEQLFEQPAKRELPSRRWTLAASRTIGCVDRAVARRTRPRLDKLHERDL